MTTNLELLPRLQRVKRTSLFGVLKYADIAIDVFGYSHLPKADLDKYPDFDLAAACGKYGWNSVDGKLVVTVTRSSRKATIEPAVKWEPGKHGAEQAKEAARAAKADTKAKQRVSLRRYS